MIPPTINASMAMFRRLLQGNHAAQQFNTVLLAKVAQQYLIFLSFLLI
jgi:hypothetical protein